MSASELYRGSLPETILDQLTTAMGVENKVGTSEEARLGAPPRVVWVPPVKGTRQYSGTAQQRAGDLHLKHVHDVSVVFLAHLWADSYAGAEDLEQRLEQALYAVFSPNAYELGAEGTQAGDSSSTGQGRGWLFVVPVKLLRVPLAVETYRTVTLNTATATSKVTDPKGGSPTSGPSPATTFP